MRILPLSLSRREAMQTPTRAFQALHEVAVAAAGLRDPNVLSELVVDRARDLLEADAAALYWWFPEAGMLRTLAHNDAQERDPEPPFKPGEGAAGKAFSTAAPLRVDDYRSWPEAVPTSVRRGIESGLAVPLMVSHRAVGVLGVFNRRIRAWTEDEEQLLMLLAAQVAPALEAARLTQETIEQAHNFRSLHEVAIAAGGLRDLAELGRLVVDHARQLLKTESATLRWWDASTASLRLLASVPALDGDSDRIAPGIGSLGQAFERREPVLIENYETALGTLEWAVGSGIKSALGVPVMAREEPLGALGVATTSERTFGREEVRLLTMLAAQVGPALEAARLYAESERRRREAEALAELVRAGAGQDDSEQAIAMIVEQACRLVGSDYAMVVLTTPEGGSEVKGRHGTRSAVWDRGVEISANGHPAQVLAAGSTVVLPSIEAAEHPIHRAEGGRSAIGVPLREGGRLIGALILGWRQPVAPEQEAVELTEAVAGYAATIIENVRGHEREHRLAVEAAARSAELAAVIDHIPAGVYVADLEGRVVLMNPAGAEMMNPGGEMGGDYLDGLDDFTILDPLTRKEVSRKELVMSRALRGETVNRAETIVQRRGGPEMWLESSAVPLRGPGGSVSGALVVFSDVTRERRLVGDLAASEERFRSLYGMVACGVLVQDSEGRVLDANGPAQEILGWSLEEMRGKKTGSLWDAVGKDLESVPLDDRPTMQALRTHQAITGRLLGVKRRDGETRWVQIDTIPVFHPDGSPLQVVSSFIDITERKAAEERLADSELKLRTIFEGAPIGLARVDLEGRIQEANLALRTMLGYSGKQLVGLRFDRVLRSSGGSELDLVEDFLREGRDHFQAELPVRPKDGTERWGSVSLALVRGASREPLYLIGMLEDITDRRAQTELLEYQALHDSLTDLPNRTLLQDRLQQATLTAQRENRQLALLIMDLNRFKDVNDTFGHHLGDVLLQQVGPRIMSLLRESDTVARLGGDEFAVVLPTADDEAGATLAARRLLKALEEPFEIEDRRLEVGGSIGIAITPQHGTDPATLMRRADIAMYVAKRTRSGFAVYSAEHDKHSPGRLTLMGELRDGLQTGALVLHYQPQVDLATSQVTGVETLIRWQHPRHGLMPPEEFLGLAEETGLIVGVSEWALNTALGQLRSWGSRRALPVAVNISMQNLQESNFPVLVAGLLERHAVPPELLKIEITEAALMADPVHSGEVLGRLRQMGVKTSIDDFGAGYSSLSHLKQLQVDELKIDHSFIVGITPHSDEVAIVRSAIDLGHSLGLKVIAEGVENQVAWDILTELGCDAIQGFLITRPLPARQLVRWLAAGVVRRAPEPTR
jgi:diguanylate cyclase (GGDEF)-like protein/PAS domain S-box-containing protein